jgi:putative tryptophan/tyrosine transport system substrate-binding protein
MSHRRPPTFRLRRLLVVIISVLMISPQHAFPAERAGSSIALLYPQSTSSARAVYDDIRDNVSRGVKSRGYRYVEMVLQQAGSDRDALRQWADRNNVAAVVALGRLANENARSLRPEIPIIAGALNLEQIPDTSGISLTPNPKLLFARLKEVAPEISRVLIICNPDRDTQLLKAARAASRELQLEISQFAAADIREATQHYYNVFRYSNPRTDAIWIIDDSLVDPDVTLPKIMENAWANNFVLISNVLDHVSRGALLATFVDPNGLGDRLSQLAADAASGKAVGQVLGEDVKFAVNARVASHLGLQLNERSKLRYGLVVGER